jgi:hypothetical protein
MWSKVATAEHLINLLKNARESEKKLLPENKNYFAAVNFFLIPEIRQTAEQS